MAEKRYESDLTAKEKRKIERENLKTMNWKQRLDHIVTYYKWHMVFGVFAILFAASIGQVIYKAQYVTILDVAFVDYMGGDSKKMETEVKEYLKDTEKFHKVSIDNSIICGSDNPEASYIASSKLAAMITAGVPDILIAPKETLEAYRDEDVFLPLSDVFSEEEIQKGGGTQDGYLMEIGYCDILNGLGFEVDSETCLAILYNADNLSNVQKFLGYLK